MKSYFSCASLLLLTLFLLCQSAQAAWYDSNFTYKRCIQIQAGQVSGSSHSDFPVLITETNIDASFFTKVQKSTTSNMDIIFVDSTETTELDREIVLYDSGDELLEAWVRIPALSGSSNTIMYMYYGNASANKPNSTATWSGSFRGVWHMQEQPDGADSILDSTSNANHGTEMNMEPSDLHSSGRIHGCLNFSGTNEYIDCGTDTSLAITGQATISAWIDLANANEFAYRTILSKKNTWDSPKGYGLEVYPGLDYVNLLAGGSDYAGTDSANHDTNWHYFVGTIDNTTGLIYKDDVSLSLADAGVGALGSDTQALHIARHSGGGGYFYGRLDEIRVHSVARDLNWITTEFNNQSNPGSFYLVQSESNNFTPTATPSGTPSATPTPSRTESATVTISATITPTATISFTPTVSPTPTHSATYTATPTVTFTPTRTITFTVSPTSTITLTSTISATITVTATATISPTSTHSPTPDYAAPDLSNVICYPNPYQAETKARPEITFFNLPRRATIRLYSISGSLVTTLEKDSPGNRLTWNLTNDQGSAVASGVYIYIIKRENEKKRGKVVLIR